MTAIKPDRSARFCPSSLLGSLVPDVDASSVASPGRSSLPNEPAKDWRPRADLHTPPYNSYIPPVVTFLRRVLRRVA